MFYLATIFSYYIFLGLTLLLTGAAINNAARQASAGILFILFPVVMFALINFSKEKSEKIKQKLESLKTQHFTKSDLYTIVFATLGMVLTFILNNELGLGPVEGSAIVGILGAVILPKYQVPIYAGSFAGMATTTAFPNYYGVVLAGVLTGLLLAGSKHILTGFGGKLGASGLFGTITASLLAGNFIFEKTPVMLNVRFFPLLYFMIAVNVTYYINKINKVGVVLASAIVGLIASILLPVMHGQQLGLTYAGAAFAGAFIGMSSIERLEREEYLLLASILGAFVYEFTMINFVGLGGRMGTTAFVSIMATLGFIEFFNLTKHNRKKYRIQVQTEEGTRDNMNYAMEQKLTQ